MPYLESVATATLALTVIECGFWTFIAWGLMRSKRKKADAIYTDKGLEGGLI